MGELFRFSPSVETTGSATQMLYPFVNSIILLDEFGTILDINDYLLKDPKNRSDKKPLWVGKSILELPGLSGLPKLHHKLRKLNSGESFSNFRVSGITQSGQKYWSRIFGSYCKKYSIVGIEDSTDQTLFESESFQAIQKFQSMFDNHPDSVFCFDFNGNILDVNPSSCKISGYSRDEMLGQNFRKFFHPDSFETMVTHTQLLFRGKAESFKAKFLHSTGRSLLLSMTFIPIAGKSHMDGYYGVAQDITKQNKLSKFASGLKDEFEDLFENAPLGLISKRKNPQGEPTILRVNLQTEKLFGFSRSELKNQSVLSLIANSDRNKFSEALQMLKKEKTITFECKGCRKDGSDLPIWVWMNQSRAFGNRTIIAIQDSSEQKRLEASLTKLVLQLEESHSIQERKTKLQELVLRMLGHDFRSPFNAILGGANLLMELGLSADQKEMVEIIHRSAQSELKLIDNLLKFSKIEEGIIQFNNRYVSSKQIVREIKDLHSESGKQKQIQIRFCQVDKVTFFIDTDLFIRNVVGNIIHNAIKYSFPNSEIRIWILKHQMNFGEIRIQDFGMGVPLDLLGDIFDINSKKNRIGTLNERSSGFGLYIAQQIIRLMGGIIRICSENQKGTVMSILAPLQPCTSEANQLEFKKNL